MKRIRYYTMNSWNLSTAPAYNMKVRNVIPSKYQDKVYELMGAEGFYDGINMLCNEFDDEHNHEWQAAFNGRSGGYLVLYRGGKHENGQPFSYPGKGIEDSEVPAQVLKDFRRLALEIVQEAIYMAKNAKVITAERSVPYQAIELT